MPEFGDGHRGHNWASIDMHLEVMAVYIKTLCLGGYKDAIWWQ